MTCKRRLLAVSLQRLMPLAEQMRIDIQLFANLLDVTRSVFASLAGSRRTFGRVSVSNRYYTLFNHGGPHVGAPNHVGLGEGLDSYSVESFAGPLKVFDFSHLPTGRSITKEMLVDLPIDPSDIVLTYTGFSLPESEDDCPQAVALDYEAATYLAALPVRAFATHALNVDSMTDRSPVPSDDEVARIIPGHHAFLSKGIPIFEQLMNVNKLLGKKSMFFVGAPLNIKDGDGMMVRPLVLVYRECPLQAVSCRSIEGFLAVLNVQYR